MQKVNAVEGNSKSPSFQICESLDSNQKEEVRKLLAGNSDLFSWSRSELSTTNATTHRIKVHGDPIRQRPYRLGKVEEDFVKKELDELLAMGFIEPSSGEWAAPIVVVPKKGEKLRLCIDYRKLNMITVKESYPIPRIEESLEALGGASVFSSLDLMSGYWQVPIQEEDRPKTGFVSKFGSYQWRVMPFGLCNAPATFQRLMDATLRKYTWQSCLVYIDDIIVFSRSFDDHLVDLNNIFNALRGANLKLNPEKCKFAEAEVLYLGHVVSKEGIKVDQNLTSAVRDFPRPQDVQQVRSFLGLANYYRKFIQNFAKVVEPITKLTRKNVPFLWSRDQESAFTVIKEKLTSAPTLAMPNFKEGNFVVQTDASDVALGAVLSNQVGGEERPVSFKSRLLNKHERNYSVNEKECLAIMWALEEFRPYVLGRKFLLETDSSALVWLQRKDDPNRKFKRWIMDLQEYDFDIRHRKGELNGNADALSRCPKLNNIEHVEEKEMKMSRAKRFELIRRVHEVSGHAGVSPTMQLIQVKCKWPGMEGECKEVISQCESCMRHKRATEKLPFIYPSIEYPFQRLSLDLIGPLPESNMNNKFIFVAIDNLTRWIEAVAIPNKNASTVAWILYRDVLVRHGAPQVIYSDQGKEFVNKIFDQLANINGIKLSNSVAHHPQSNGLVERANQTLIRKLKAMLTDAEAEWDLVLPAAVYAHRISPIKDIGRSPFELLYGRAPNIHLDPLEYPEWSRLAERCAFKIFRDFEDLKRRESPRVASNYEKGDWVMVRKHAVDGKLDTPYSGPFRIAEPGDMKTALVEVNGELVRYHYDQLKKLPHSVRRSNEARRGTVGKLVLRLPVPNK